MGSSKLQSRLMLQGEIEVTASCAAMESGGKLGFAPAFSEHVADTILYLRLPMSNGNLMGPLNSCYLA